MMSMGMDLETYRLKRGLSYADLALELGLTQRRQAMAYALGEIWPKAQRLEQIIRWSDGEVSADAMHARRMKWLMERRAVPPTTEGAVLA
jgi:hypothetical protein